MKKIGIISDTHSYWSFVRYGQSVVIVMEATFV